jgi:hypothetical protein
MNFRKLNVRFMVTLGFMLGGSTVALDPSILAVPPEGEGFVKLLGLLVALWCAMSIGSK